MRKYLTICFLVFSIVMSMIPVHAADSGPLFSVRVPTELPKAGDKFEVTVELSGNTGFCAIDFKLSYDTEAMKCEDIFMDDILSGALSAGNPEYNGCAVIGAASLKAIKDDGVLAFYQFTAKKDITAFEFLLKDITFADIDGNKLDYKIEDSVDGEKTPPPEEDTNDYDEEAVNPNPEDVFLEDGFIYDEGFDLPEYSEDITDTELDINEPEPSPEEDATVEPEMEEPTSEPAFPDVVGHWAEKYVSLAAKQGLFMGDTDGNFNPDDNVTRAQFVTVLWRMAGRPDVDAELPFSDTEDQISEFKKAIAWGYANGYIKGTSDTTFEPGASLTREAGMKILHSYSGAEIGKEIQLYAVYDGTFKDSPDISDWAKQSVYWGIYNKLISGTSSSTLTPKGTATRAQLATILVNYLDIK